MGSPTAKRYHAAVRARRLAFASLLVAPIAPLSACRSATQIEVTVTTDLPCDSTFRGATITVGTLGVIENQAVTATKSTCTAGGKVGTIVIQPSGANDDLVGMKIVAGVGQSAANCTAENKYQGCIVARRALRFLPHEGLHVVVGLDAACKDIPCGDHETCVDSVCRPATIDDSSRCESASGCGDEVLDGGARDGTVGDGGEAGASDSGVDGETGAPDVTTDAGPPVPGAVTAGSGHSCALTSSGGVKCWGDDSVGQRGDNYTTASGAIFDVLTDPATQLSGASAITTGADTTCAFLPGGAVKCWGIALDTPPPDGGPPTTYGVATDWASLANATQISFGYHFLCWRQGTLHVKCMGRNDSGELGTGNTNYGSPPGVQSGYTAPILQVAGGEFFSCALQGTGQIYCVGDNSANECDPTGSSGTMFTSPHLIGGLPPTMAEVQAGVGWACGRASDGSVLCWGDNQHSTLGIASDAGRTSGPIRVRTATAPLSGTKALVAGDFYACVITSANRVACWGNNDHGQLGRGAVGGESPVAVELSLSNVVSLSAGNEHVCAKDSQNHVWCWGNNQLGQCSTSSNPDVSQPNDVGVF
jgi:alpha-tubulin suppressor-like RCC1 family protein